MSYNFYSALNESYSVPKPFILLNEAAQVQVTDEVMTSMFKMVSEKYTSIDFKEIEKSNGDLRKFKYLDLLKDNIQTLAQIYATHDAKPYLEYVRKMETIINALTQVKVAEDMSYLYMKGHGMLQMYYVSTVAALIYGTSALISMTIRFITNNDTDDVEVVFDEIPNPTKYVHLTNIDKAHALVQDGTLTKMLAEYRKANTKSLNEAIIPIALSTPMIIAAAIPAILYLSTKIIPFIREVIYTVYFTRVKMETAIDLQVNLIKTNIESLETGRGSKKIIVRQKRVIKTLEKLKDMVMVKSDKANVEIKKQITKENRELKVPDRPSANTGVAFSDDLLL